MTERDGDGGRTTARARLGAHEFRKLGISRYDLRDPYHLAVALSWPEFFAALLTLYLAVNMVFATLYTLVPGCVTNARPHVFSDAFFFSFETLATVGYGEMYPATLYGHLVAATEIVCGLTFTAILTGLTFVRFSRPRAKFVFAEHPVVALHNGTPTLMLRIGNGRVAVLADASAKVSILLSATSAEGATFRTAVELPLERSRIPIFPLSWTLMHVIDEQSALHGYDSDRLVEAEARLFVTLEARDPTISAVVHDVRNYSPEDVRFGMRYADAISTGDRTSTLDLARIGLLQADVAERPIPG